MIINNLNFNELKIKNVKCPLYTYIKINTYNKVPPSIGGSLFYSQLFKKKSMDYKI